MANVELRTVKFDVVGEAEKKQFLKRQRVYRVKCFLKRMMILLVICGIFVGFQLLARKTAPNRFGEGDTAENLLIITAIVFLVVNIISYIQLLFQTKVLFDIKTTPVLKVLVKKKMVTDRTTAAISGTYSGRVMPMTTEKDRFVMCEMNGDFILNRIRVHGRIPFSNIKNGMEIYVGYREKVSGGVEYYYLA